MAAHAPAQAQESLVTSDTSYLVHRVNEVRAAHGLAPLAWSLGLSAFAEAKTAEVCARDTLWHSYPTVASADAIGEDVGRGAGTSDVQHAFELSPTHSAIMLDPGWHRIGVAVSRCNGWTVVDQYYVDP